MGKLIDGVWTKEADVPASKVGDGAYRREASSMRNWVTPDGAPGPSGEGGFEAAPGRYHLYVAVNCPWAHRTLIFRILKRLQDVVSLTTVLPRRTEEGWVFDNDSPAHRDPVMGARALHEIYTAAEPSYSGRVTVPVIWDKARRTIVNNESSEIIRMLNSAFTALTEEAADYYPQNLRTEIDALNDEIYANVNNGVYRCGFARTQAAYEAAFDDLFATLDRLDRRLADRRYLAGARPTEADWRLFPTLARFDVAYYGAFKCNLRRLADYENLWPYARELYQWPGIAETVDLDLYKRGYYSISALRNPSGIVPMGPRPDFDRPHGRDAF